MNKIIKCIEPRGFCAGVTRALKILDQTLPSHPYVLHDIVHNDEVVNSYKAQQVKFVESLDEIPEGSTCVISAHGTSKSTYAEAKKKNIQVFDATCPLVKKVHKQALDYEQEGRTIFIIGQKNHPEIRGLVGQLSPKTEYYIIPDIDNIPNISADAIGLVTQTTYNKVHALSIIKELSKKYKNLKYSVGVCDATDKRQNAVREATQWADLIIVVGDNKSSNARKLTEIAQENGKESYIVQNLQDFKTKKINASHIAITAAASAPESIVQSIYAHLQKRYSR